MRREPFSEPAAVIDPPALRVTVGAQRPDGPAAVLAPSRAWTIGRAGEADVVVDDTQVSRRHLVLEPAGSVWVVRDVSSNGSWSAGGRLPAGGITVPPGAEVVVRLGAPTGPEVVLTSAAAVPAPPPAFAPVRPARRRRRGRRAAIVIGVLVVLLLAADRIAATVAGTAAVSQIVQQSEGLVGEPDVSFGGFPFLTQVATGDYSDVHVELTAVIAPDAPRIDRIDAHLPGAHLPLSAIVGGDVSSVPVDRVDATVEIGFDDLNAYLAGQTGGPVLRPAGGGAIGISADLDLDGSTVAITGTARLEVDGGQLVVTPQDVQVADGGALGGLGDVLGSVASLLPPVPVPLGALPFDLRLTSVEVGDDGVTASAQASGLTLEVPQ